MGFFSNIRNLRSPRIFPSWTEGNARRSNFEDGRDDATGGNAGGSNELTFSYGTDQVLRSVPTAIDYHSSEDSDDEWLQDRYLTHKNIDSSRESSLLTHSEDDNSSNNPPATNDKYSVTQKSAVFGSTDTMDESEQDSKASREIHLEREKIKAEIERSMKDALEEPWFEVPSSPVHKVPPTRSMLFSFPFSCFIGTPGRKRRARRHLDV
jgi:hypothetical protein